MASTQTPNPRRSFRTVLFAVGKRVPFVLTLARASAARLRFRRYRRLWADNPVQPESAVFESYLGRGYSCSPRAISEAMARDPRFAGYRRTWAFTQPVANALAERGFAVAGVDPAQRDASFDLDAAFDAEALEALRDVDLVARLSHAYNRAFASAAVWVVNSRMPAYLHLRDGQTLVQTWHGSPLKRLGLDIVTDTWANPIYTRREWETLYRSEGERMTYLLAQSPFAAKALASTFGFSPAVAKEKVLELGYPRNDRLFDVTPERVERIKRGLGIPAGNRVVLYAPTWRDDQHASDKGYVFESPIDFDRLRERLGEDVTVLFRAHYLVANSFDFEHHRGFVIDASKVNDINDLYVISDALVTDYSSVFFDYANLRRPILFYMYDLERYANEVHGFYLDLSELPGPILKTQAELEAALTAAENPSADDLARLDAFVHTYEPHDDGRASERVIERAIPPVR